MENKENDSLDNVELAIQDNSVEDAAEKQEKANRAREKELKKEYKKLKRQKHPFMRALKYGFVGLLIGAVIGAGVVLWIQHNAPDPVEESDVDAVTVILERVMEEGELVTASQTYVEIEKVTDKKSFFDLFDLPFTENSYWYRYAGTIKAAVDLGTAELIKRDGDVVTLAIEPPYISSNTPDMEKSEVLEENNNILNPIRLKDADGYKREVVKKVEAAAVEGDLFEVAKSNAEAELSQLFSVALGGEYTVVIEWIEESES